jgi:hypothetical protein
VLAGIALTVSVTAYAENVEKTFGQPITVYKTPTCGCCKAWVDHLRNDGFRVTAIDLTELGRVKAENGVPIMLQSCHTAVVEGYTIEGHVPMADIWRLLKQRPDVRGISVPGMPAGSPGMESPNPQPYDVLTFDDEGNVEIFASH